MGKSLLTALALSLSQLLVAYLTHFFIPSLDATGRHRSHITKTSLMFIIMDHSIEPSTHILYSGHYYVLSGYGPSIRFHYGIPTLRVSCRIYGTCSSSLRRSARLLVSFSAPRINFLSLSFRTTKFSYNLSASTRSSPAAPRRSFSSPVSVVLYNALSLGCSSPLRFQVCTSLRRGCHWFFSSVQPVSTVLFDRFLSPAVLQKFFSFFNFKSFLFICRSARHLSSLVDPLIMFFSLPYHETNFVLHRSLSPDSSPAALLCDFCYDAYPLCPSQTWLSISSTSLRSIVSTDPSFPDVHLSAKPVSTSAVRLGHDRSPQVYGYGRFGCSPQALDLTRSRVRAPRASNHSDSILSRLRASSAIRRLHLNSTAVSVAPHHTVNLKFSKRAFVYWYIAPLTASSVSPPFQSRGYLTARHDLAARDHHRARGRLTVRRDLTARCYHIALGRLTARRDLTAFRFGVTPTPTSLSCCTPSPPALPLHHSAVHFPDIFPGEVSERNKLRGELPVSLVADCDLLPSLRDSFGSGWSFPRRSKLPHRSLRC